MSTIGILVASSNNNLKLAQKLQELANTQGLETEIIDLVALDLPLYTTMQEEKSGIPEAVKELASKIIGFKAFIVVAPEYNGVMPPVLNNAISWSSRATEDWRESFNEKFVALATHSGGGGTKVLQAMRLQFIHMGANVLGRELLTSYDKPLNEESANNILEQLGKLTKI